MTRSQFLKVLAEYQGVALDEESERDGVLQIDTPKGKIFSANGCHTLVEPFTNNGGQSWKSDAYADLVRRLRYGLGDCDTAFCEVCG